MSDPTSKTAETTAVANQTPDPYEGLTPIMRQYRMMRDENPNCLLLYRLGDFYETFFEDAHRINRLIGLTLTRRGTFKGEPIPMCGIPYATLDQYLERLVKLGESIAICEQIGDPTPGKGMMERKITRIVTPGTITDNALLSAKSDSTLLAVCYPRLKSTDVALVWLTLTNGEFHCAKTSLTALASQIARIAPSEILLKEDVKEDLSGRLFLHTALTEIPDWYFDSERGSDTLRHRFQLDNLDAWGIEHETEILSAANALLSYVDQTQRENAPYIKPLVMETDSSFVVLDAATRRNLEITETLKGESGPTLFGVMDACRTSMGSRLMKNWLHQPLRDQEAVNARLDGVEELLTLSGDGQKLAELLKEVPDIERIAGRIALRSIRPKEAAALRDALPLLKSLSEMLSCCHAKVIGENAKKIALDGKLWQKLTETLLDEPATLLREGDVIRSEANAQLRELREMRDNAGNFLVELEARERERTGITNLRIEYNRVSGYFIEVTKAQANQVPEDYRRRQTLKNTERFITPELKEFEDRALSAKERASQLDKTLWEELVSDLACWVENIMASARAVATIDVLAAFAKHALEAKWCRPSLEKTPGLRIQGARHPVVETMVNQYVPNDCRLEVGRRLLIITGPNMGGKSTYMRSIALISLLAYAGSFVPAAAASLGPIDKILTRIGASDDLARGRSTFMVEMTEAAAILHQATDRSLVLMDEIGRGTSTFDGLSLAGAIAQDLVLTAHSWTLFATHYFELTQLANELPEAANVHVCAEQSGKNIAFLHDVRPGAASQSYGIAVASLAGVPARVIRKAKALLSKLETRALENGPQPDLFANAAAQSRVQEAENVEDTAEPCAYDTLIEDLKALDIDKLTPRDALNLLYQIKERIQQ